MKKDQDFNYQDFKFNMSEHELKHAPKDLYYEGDTNLLLTGKRISVVGSRNPSPQGIKRAEILTEALIEQGIIVVSGLAAGIDTVAHKTAIKNHGRTIAVLGTPLNMAYPSENRELLDIIKDKHLAVSQFPLGSPVQRKNFPMRNRTMALISDATIIIEASENSGTKHQGWEALRLGRCLYIMSNIIENNNITWPKEMMKYGAQILTREDLPFFLDEIPHFTSSINADIFI